MNTCHSPASTWTGRPMGAPAPLWMPSATAYIRPAPCCTPAARSARIPQNSNHIHQQKQMCTAFQRYGEPGINCYIMTNMSAQSQTTEPTRATCNDCIIEDSCLQAMPAVSSLLRHTAKEQTRLARDDSLLCKRHDRGWSGSGVSRLWQRSQTFRAWKDGKRCSCECHQRPDLALSVVVVQLCRRRRPGARRACRRSRATFA